MADEPMMNFHICVKRINRFHSLLLVMFFVNAFSFL